MKPWEYETPDLVVKFDRKPSHGQNNLCPPKGPLGSLPTKEGSWLVILGKTKRPKSCELRLGRSIATEARLGVLAAAWASG